MPRSLRVMAVAMALAGCAAPTSDAVDESSGQAATIESEVHPGALDVDSMDLGPIEGRYIVMLDREWLDDEVASRSAEPTLPGDGELAPGHEVMIDPALLEQTARAVSEQAGARFVHTIGIIDGFVVEDATAAAIAALENDPRVDVVEQDQIVTINETQNNATWGLDRLDQNDRPLDRRYTYDATGAGVTAYIIDTGLRDTHREFTGRVRSGMDYIGDGRGTGDCNGHGTHVAGTVAGTTFGVAKEAVVVPLRVFGCTGGGSNSGILSGLNLAARNSARPAVVNMSLGGGISNALDRAVANAVAAGVVVVVAAGNENQDACNVSPARAPDAITVAASTSSDQRASFSNFGRCVDIFAPGQSITSAGISSDSSSANMSGTSMASPHVAGVAALILSANRGATPGQVLASMLSRAPTGKIANPNGSPNALLSVRGIGGGGSTPEPEPEPEPTPEPGDPCDGACERFTGTLSAGQRQTQPDGMYFRAPAGTHRAFLRGPAGTDFDIRLYQWNGSSWTEVASSLSDDSDEAINYSGSAGFFVYQLHAYSGSGSFELGIDRP